MFALATDTLLGFFHGSANISEHLLALPPRDIAIPVVVLYDLETAISRSTDSGSYREQLGDFLALVSVLPVGTREVRVAAAIRRDLEAAGKQVDALDILAAGVALAHEATLVTQNTRPFAVIESLNVTDWN